MIRSRAALRLPLTLFALASCISARAEVVPEVAPPPAPRFAQTFNVGQVYAGGHVGFAIPTAIGRGGGELSFRDVAKTGFVVYADVMKQMNQSIGLGAEAGFRNYPYNDKKTWSNLTRYGQFEASYRAIDLNLMGRLFFSRNAIRPVLGIVVGGELIMNSVDFTPNNRYEGVVRPTVYETRSVSPAFGVMTGAYYKAGRRTLVSLQLRLNFVPRLKDDTIEVDTGSDIQSIAQNPHGNQTNISVSLGLHVGTQRNNRR